MNLNIKRNPSHVLWSCSLGERCYCFFSQSLDFIICIAQAELTYNEGGIWAISKDQNII